MFPQKTKRLFWFFTIAVLPWIAAPVDGQCDPAWSDVTAGFDARVYDLAEYNGELYAAGDFANIVDPTGTTIITAAPRVAKWNGVAWTPVGTLAFDDSIFDLEVIDLGGGPLLFAAGRFTGRLASYDGVDWTLFPVSPGPQIRCVTAFGNQLITGGNWNDGVRAFDGVSWVALGAGLERTPPDGTTSGNPAPIVYDLHFFDGLLYAVGLFTCALDVPGGGLDCGTNGILGTNRIARWTGGVWESVDGGIVAGPNAQKLYSFPIEGVDNLIVSGRFDSVGGLNNTPSIVTANNVAAWNAIDGWRALDSVSAGVGTAGVNSALALAAFDDGMTGTPALHVGGAFGLPYPRVVSYAGANYATDTWQPLDGGVGSTVRALLSHDDGSGAALYAAGDFLAADAGAVTAARIVRYSAVTGPDCNMNGIADRCDIALGTSPDCNANGVPDECDVNTISLDCDMNGVPDECQIAAGTSQDCNGNMLPDACEIADMSVPDCNANGVPDSCDLGTGGISDDCDGNSVPDECDVAAGALDTNGDNVPDACQMDRCLPGFDNTIPGLDNQVWASATLYGDLIVAGDFIQDSALTTTLNNIARYDGSAWVAIADGFDARVRALGVFDIDGNGDKLYAGGDFLNSGTTAISHVAVWTGTAWEQVGNGLTANCFALEMFQGDLYAGGQFGQRLRRFDPIDGTWDPLASGVTGGVNGVVYALEVHDDGVSGEQLYAGGNFECVGDTAIDCLGAGAVPALDVARWDGATWTSVDGGIGGPTDYVWTLESIDLDDGANAQIYAGGLFSLAGISPANSVARYDGVSWSGMGEGVIQTTGNALVRNIKGFDDKSGGGAKIYIAGQFNESNLVLTRRFARFDGTDWNELANGIGGQAWTMVEYAQDGMPSLVVGGVFTAGSGLTAERIIRWDAAFDLSGGGVDCDDNGQFDFCELAADPSLDCDLNGQMDLCQLLQGYPDCNNNQVLDICDIASGTSQDINMDGQPDECLHAFVRADANLDTMIDIADVITILDFLFLGGSTPACADAYDSNDDESTDIGDGLWIINYLFGGGLPPFAPFPNCGTDPTGLDLDCDSYPACL